MEHRHNCIICGSELKYSKESIGCECYYCGTKQNSNAICLKGHYVCDACHAKGAYDIINEFCTLSDSKNPINMARDLMKHHSIKMHGPEHHFLVPAVLISSFCNATNSTKEEKVTKLNECAKRAKNVLGGFCGFYGSCGAGVGTGICISIITGATPLTRESWKLSNLMTSKSLYGIAEKGGPRCCKRGSFIAIECATEFIEKELKVKLQREEKFYCEFSNLNNQCIKEHCDFYRR